METKVAKDTTTRITIPKKQLTTNHRATPKFFVEKMCLLNSTNDLKHLNYNKYGTKGHHIYPIGSMFCDNFLLSTPADLNRPSNGGVTDTSIPPNTNGRQINKTVGLFNHRINTVLIKHNQPKAFIKAVGITPDGRQKYKVSCHSIPLNKVIEIIQDPEFATHDITLQDIDITQDFAGCFNKQEIIDAMAEMDFTIQGVDFMPNKDKDSGHILDNSYLVGENCLTYMCDNIRSKIYNKFAQEVECDSVRDNIGHHLHNWCHPPFPYRTTVQESLPHGLLRMETTYYGGVIPTKEQMQEDIGIWIEILAPKLCYSTPIAKQWMAVAERVKKNLVVKCGDLIYVCHWINSLTGKIGGCLKETNDQRDYQWMLTELTFNKPIDVIELCINEDTIDICSTSYNKILMPNKNTAARLVSRKFIYQCGTADPSKYGIIPYNGVEFYTSTKHAYKKSSPRFALQKIHPTNIYCADKKLAVKQGLKTLESAQKELKAKRKAKIKQDKEDVENIASVANDSSTSSLTYLPDGAVLEVVGAIERQTRYGKTFVLTTADKKTYWANTKIKDYLNSLKPTVTYNDRDVLKCHLGIKIVKHSWSLSRHKLVDVDIMVIADTKPDIELEPKSLQKREGNLGRPKDYKKLDNAEVGAVLNVKEYGILQVRGVDRYVLFTDKGQYIDNWFLRQAYSNKKDVGMLEHKIICMGPKTTPQKHKEMYVKCVGL